jgi:hypothetical protein
VACPDDVIGVAFVDKTVDMDTVKRIIYLRWHILKYRGLTAKTIQRGARYMLVLGNSLRTLDMNCVRCSLTCALLHYPNEAEQASCRDQTNHCPRYWDSRAG